MKILFYINTIAHGGAERAMTNLATEMSTRGHRCILVTTNYADTEYDLDEHVDRRVLFETRPSSFIERNFKVVKRLRKIIKTEYPDIMVTFMGEPNIRGLIARLGLPVKSVISVRNDPQREYPGLFLRVLSKCLFRLADCVVFQTSDAQKWFPSSIQAKSTIIYNPVKDIFYRTSLTENRHGIVTVGRIVEQKNHTMLLKAYSTIADKIKDDLFIYGSGDTSLLISQAKDLGIYERVHFLGSSDSIYAQLAKFRLFVLSSDYEGMPNALMEAMAVGLPCISTDCPCGGPRMLLSGVAKDYLVGVGDYQTLGKKMLEVLSENDKEVLLSSECKKASYIFESSLVYDAWENKLSSLL